ncbi:hypothetical protein TPHA_0E02680 [Tetrapisispora phaffii CBS 4417]|uniref:Ams2/SPT21 N-terminal domain-containing protein n=1 Tax=Tetrapisispora phaffii (strain ATCC 24235 / CBS 4417 / NBRC 1672 / NRRL Y-8282 / UCD 70-5) TaxID=1071381 RepID=G8BTY1_TETPH|nr:hypothetical protein TPHA_0E02680 [Tetrapisispora phaffii CBS 4417]CCE63359.1 hypothetical protein TPHA_0E02680 [Tetrapisispora phaffii CBS 4417]
MSESVYMNLKILYSLENSESIVTTYLSRSKTSKEVQVMTVALNSGGDNNETINSKIGAVPLHDVLDEIYESSPELIDHKVETQGFDYNIYYKDVCEIGEPLVSLGFLSKIRSQKENKELMVKSSAIENEDEDELIVIGSVCSNFASLLKKSYINSSKKGNNKLMGKLKDNVSIETLEIKLQFSKIFKQTVKPAATKYVKPAVKGVRSAVKRQTNPKPAPKAIRTQSLPIWNPMQVPGQALPASSIAHKIYMADKQNETKNSCNQPTNNSQKGRVNINSKVKINDSVSKRFDFMLKKKKTTKFVKSPNPNTATRAHRMNTTPVIMESNFASATFKEKSTKNINQIHRKNSIDFGDIANFANNKLSSNLKKVTNFEEQNSLEADKENIQPSTLNGKPNSSAINMNSNANAFNLLTSPDFNLKKDLDWLDDYDIFNSSIINNESVNVNALFTTPNDANACNTNQTEELDNDFPNSNDFEVQAVDMQTAVTNEIGRTSPMTKQHNNGNINADLDNSNDVDNTSIVFAPTSVINSPDGEKSVEISDNFVNSINVTSKRPCESELEYEVNNNIKKQRTIPSSPVNMFQYQATDDNDNDSVDPINSDDKNELFSSYINVKSYNYQNSHNSTPVSSYLANSSDALDDFQK